MTPQVAIGLLAVCSTMVTLITEAIKKTEIKVPSNIIALVVSVLVGILVPVGYLILSGVQGTIQDAVYIISLVILTWLVAMLGYDKVVQSILQLKGKGNTQ